MKIRTGFVSNSSSSSYVCDVSGEAFEVEDGCFWDAGLAQCKNDHIFKKEFLVPWTPEFPSRDKMLAKLDSVTDSKRVCEGFRALKDAELKAVYIKTLKLDEKYEVSVNQCPICTLNRLGDSSLLDFLLKKSNSSREAVLKQIQSAFGSFGQFENYLYNP